MTSNESRQDVARTMSRMVLRLYRQHRSFMNNRLEGTGLKGPLHIFLITLDHHPGSSQDFLAQRIGIDKSGVARAARELEEMGYIRREIDDDNRRQYCMTLTDAGRAMLPAICAGMNEWNDMLTKGLSDEQIREVISLMERMSKNVEQ